MQKKLLKNGEIVSSDGIFRRDILIEGKKIIDISEPGGWIDGDVENFDCNGMIILPGLIDVHVHFREPGATYKEDFETGSKAAVAGGVTTVFDMPNNNPPIVSLKDLEAKRKLIAGRSFVNYGLYIGFNGLNVSEINKAENIPGVKFYACDSTGDMGVNDQKAIEELFKKSNKRIVVHAEDPQIVQKNMEEYLAEGVEPSMDVHSKIRSVEVAVKMVEKVCKLAKKTGAKLHIAHVSSEAEIEVINQYKEFGVTCEVAPHHLLLSEDDYEFLKGFAKMNPPVRSRMDVFAMWKALKFGELDIIATDHAPHTLVEKEQGYKACPSGVPELDTLLPIMLNTVNSEGMTLEEVVRVCCEKPAEIFSLKNKGYLREGYDADIVVVDMDIERKVERKNLFTKCGWSPYEESVFKGWPIFTFVNGELIFKTGKIVGKPIGKEVEFE